MGLFKRLFGGPSDEAMPSERVPAPDPMRRDQKSRPPPPKTPPPPPRALQGQPVRLAGVGRVSVVGESHYQPALRAAAKDRAASGDIRNALQVKAVLVPEPTNPHDRNAVRVDVDGRPVGYLAREHALLYQPVLRSLESKGKVGWCPARIMGGGNRYYGIWLHLSPPELMVCQNRADDLEVLDADWHVTVVGEERHQEVLERVAAGRRSTPMFVSLERCTIERGKYKGEEGVEIRVDGESVGELTKAMVDRYVALLRTVPSGLTPGCEAMVNLTEKGYQVELHMPRVLTGPLLSGETTPTPSHEP